jgi:hypothetical protein
MDRLTGMTKLAVAFATVRKLLTPPPPGPTNFEGTQQHIHVPVAPPDSPEDGKNFQTLATEMFTPLKF